MTDLSIEIARILTLTDHERLLQGLKPHISLIPFNKLPMSDSDVYVPTHQLYNESYPHCMYCNEIVDDIKLHCISHGKFKVTVCKDHVEQAQHDIDFHKKTFVYRLNDKLSGTYKILKSDGIIDDGWEIYCDQLPPCMSRDQIHTYISHPSNKSHVPSVNMINYKYGFQKIVPIYEFALLNFDTKPETIELVIEKLFGVKTFNFVENDLL